MLGLASCNNIGEYITKVERSKQFKRALRGVVFCYDESDDSGYDSDNVEYPPTICPSPCQSPTRSYAPKYEHAPFIPSLVDLHSPSCVQSLENLSESAGPFRYSTGSIDNIEKLKDINAPGDVNKIDVCDLPSGWALAKHLETGRTFYVNASKEVGFYFFFFFW